MAFTSGEESRPFRIAVAPTVRLDLPEWERTLSTGEPLFVDRYRVYEDFFSAFMRMRRRERDEEEFSMMGSFFLRARWDRETGRRGFIPRFSFAQRIVWRSIGLNGVAAMGILLVATGADWAGASVGLLGLGVSWLELRRGWVRLSRRATALTATAIFFSLATVLTHGLRETLSRF